MKSPTPFLAFSSNDFVCWLHMQTQVRARFHRNFYKSECWHSAVPWTVNRGLHQSDLQFRGKAVVGLLPVNRPTNLPMSPASEELLMKFVAYLAQSIKHSSIKCYLAAVRHLHIRMGYELDLKKFVRLQLVCRWVKRSLGDRTRVRLPITIHHLHLFMLS